jgi:hypothetical protein
LVLTGGAVTVSSFQYLSRALLWLNQQDEDAWRRTEDPHRKVLDESRRRYSA